MQHNDSGSVFQPEEVKELIKALKEYTPTVILQGCRYD